MVSKRFKKDGKHNTSKWALLIRAKIMLINTSTDKKKIKWWIFYQLKMIEWKDLLLFSITTVKRSCWGVTVYKIHGLYITFGVKVQHVFIILFKQNKY